MHCNLVSLWAISGGSCSSLSAMAQEIGRWPLAQRTMKPRPLSCKLAAVVPGAVQGRMGCILNGCTSCMEDIALPLLGTLPAASLNVIIIWMTFAPLPQQLGLLLYPPFHSHPLNLVILELPHIWNVKSRHPAVRPQSHSPTSIAPFFLFL